MALRFKITLDTSGLEEQLARLASAGKVEAVIRNTAQSEDGFYYFNVVNDGRGPVRPVEAKALHWVDPKSGADVFSKYSGPSAPRHMKERAAPVIRRDGAIMAQTWEAGGELGRETIVEFVNQLAERIAVPALKAVTPTVSGKLQQSYEIEKAK